MVYHQSILGNKTVSIVGFSGVKQSIRDRRRQVLNSVEGKRGWERTGNVVKETESEISGI